MASIRRASTAWSSGFVSEVVMTMMFLFIIMGATHGKAPAGFAPLAIGLGLTLIHLVSIPVTNTSVNPARSTGRRCSSAAGRWRSSGCSGSPRCRRRARRRVYRWISEEPTGVVEGLKTA